MNDTVLIIDSNCLGHIAKHSMRGLSYEEKETGVIFGFMQFIFRLAKKFETNKFVFCWDSRKSYRRELYAGYKKRNTVEKTAEDEELNNSAHYQFFELRKNTLPNFGFSNVYQKTGYEADDLIASVAMNNNRYEKIIVANDEDLYQLLDFAKIYNPRKKEIITRDTFQKEYGIFPCNWHEVKAIAGCGSDSVKGVPGVGQKTAIRYLTGELKKGKAYINIKNERDGIILRNKLLVTLPYYQTEKIKISFKKDKFLLSAFHSICDSYGFTSIKKETNAWIKLFGMK